MTMEWNSGLKLIWNKERRCGKIALLSENRELREDRL